MVASSPAMTGDVPALAQIKGEKLPSLRRTFWQLIKHFDNR